MNKARRPKTIEEIEKSLRFMIIDMEQYHIINPEGNLDESYILSSIIQNNTEAAVEYKKMIDAYKKLCEKDASIKGLVSGKVSEKTLKNILLMNEYLVRPIKTKYATRNRSIYFGEIIKLPALLGECLEGDEWKTLLKKETDFKLGDTVLYSFKNDLILDHELLHVVGCFTGKILK